MVCPESVSFCFLAILWVGPWSPLGYFSFVVTAHPKGTCVTAKWSNAVLLLAHTRPPFPSAPAGDMVRLPVHEITSSRATPWKPKCCLVTHSWKYQKHFSICHIGKEHWLLDLEAFCCAWQGHAPLSCIQYYLQARKWTSHLMEGLGEGGGVRHRKYFSRIVCAAFS